MILYHYTSPDHLPLILRSGLLKVTESNLSLLREHAGPDVVWLTKDPDLAASSAAWAHNSIHDKTRIRFTVDANRRAAQPWTDWAARRGIDPIVKKALINTGGPGWRRWYVTERPILASEWVEILDRSTGEPIERRTGLPTHEGGGR